MFPPVSVAIRPAAPEQIDQARRLFREYADALGVDLCFQNFEAELGGLPGGYAPPSGALLLALAGDDPVGCVALRRLDARHCEMKRLYVSPSQRGTGLGRRLALAILAEARSRGYSAMRLDTLPQMGAAIALYRGLGFREIPPYTVNPVPGALFLEKDLSLA